MGTEWAAWPSAVREEELGGRRGDQRRLGCASESTLSGWLRGCVPPRRVFGCRVLVPEAQGGSSLFRGRDMGEGSSSQRHLSGGAQERFKGRRPLWLVGRPP